ncbi:hypothetical protein M422DRAFT_239214 [Sphaerobolus stellatus SS14]|nr:hypothetical protein M422DRAFT_239214 [Sphaerobolus stellatus SS14]
MALTCKNLHHMIISSHLYFRRVEVHKHNPLYSLIASRPLFAANVRHLTIPTRGSSQPLPQGIIKLIGDEQSKKRTRHISAQLSKVVAQMRDLAGFSWLGKLPSYREDLLRLYRTFEAVSNSCLDLKFLALYQYHTIIDGNEGQSDLREVSTKTSQIKGFGVT